MRRALFMIALALVLAPACKKDKDNTKIIVAVWSDLSLVNELDAVRIEVQGPTETRGKTFPLTPGDDPSKYSLPVRLELVPEGAKNMTITVKAAGLRNSGEVVAQSARVSFVSGQALVLKLFLGRTCVGKTCAGDVTCAQGVCDQPIAVPSLPPYAPGNLLAPDAGVKLDASVAIEAGGALDGKAAPDLRAVESNPVEAPADVPIPVSGTGGITGGTGGAIGSGGSTGAGGATGSGGAPGLDASTIDATMRDAADAPMLGTGGVIGGVGGATAAGGSSGTGGASGVGGASGTGGTMETCVFGVSRFGNCKFGP